MSARSREDSWRLGEGDEIAPSLSAMRLLGGGSSYEAYLAFDEVTFGPVVVKVLRPSRTTDASALRGLQREVTALGEVNHPVVVRGLRHDLESERPHVVLECIDGPRLSSLLRRHGPLSPQQYLPLALDVCSALHYLRHVEYVHLDLKPSNIIMGSPARVIDLSVARPVDSAARITAQIGTDAYMAPEQAAPGDRGVPGPASDVWGLGATLFEAVAGYRAFSRGEPDDGAELARRFPQLVEQPRALPDRTPGEVVKTVMATLAPDPADRPTPAEVSTALEPVLARQPRARLSSKLRA